MAKRRSYAELAIGSRFPDEPASFVVTDAKVREYCAISGVNEPTEAPCIVPPTLAAVYIRPAQNALNGPPGGIHAKQRFIFHAPIRIGDVLRTVLEVIEKFERKGKDYVVSVTRTTNQDGVLVCVGYITQIWGSEP